MVLRQSPGSRNYRSPARRSSPPRTLKDNRCFECQLGAPPDTHHATCIHRNDFAPTPNRFSILAGLNPSPETHWALDFVPTSRSATRRRGKRGGRQQRLKNALKKARETPEAGDVDEICDRFAALHLDDHAPPSTAPRETGYRPLPTITPDLNSVRHHWAPQFRPNSLPASPPSQTKPTNVQTTTLSQHSTLGQGHWADAPPSMRKLSPKFPLSAFLKELTTPTDYAGYWPTKSSVHQPATPPRTPKASSRQFAAPLATQDLSAKPRSSNIQDRINTPAPSNAIGPQRVVPTTPSLSTNAVPTYKPFPAFGSHIFTPSPGLFPDTSATPTLTPSLVTQPVVLSTPQPKSPWAPAPSVLATALESVAATAGGPNLWTVPCLTSADWSHTTAAERFTAGSQETRGETNMFRPSPSALVTAPVTSPNPFVYPYRPWPPSAVSRSLFKNSAAFPVRIRSKFEFNPDPPNLRVTRDEFLEMGHARECWCDSYKEARQAQELANNTAALGNLEAKSASDRFEYQRQLFSAGSGDDTPPVDNTTSLQLKTRPVHNDRADRLNSSRTSDSRAASSAPSMGTPFPEQPTAYTSTRAESFAASSVGTQRRSCSFDNSPGAEMAAVTCVDISSFVPPVLGEVLDADTTTIPGSHSEVDAAGPVGHPNAFMYCSRRPSASGSQAAPLSQHLSSTLPGPALPEMTLDPSAASFIAQEHISASDAGVNDMHLPCDVPGSGDEFESDLSDYNPMVLTPSSESLSFEFEEIPILSSESMQSEFDELEVIEGLSVVSDEDWSDVSPDLHVCRPTCTPMSPTLSDASAQSSGAPLIASSPLFAPSSPLQIRSSSEYPAQFADAESDTD